jgi:hypothetical protein
MSTETPETPDQPDQPEREVEHPEREAEQSPAAPETEPGNGNNDDDDDAPQWRAIVRRSTTTPPSATLHDLTILLLGNAATVYALTQHRPAAVIATESGATSYQRPGAAPDNPTGV